MVNVSMKKRRIVFLKSPKPYLSRLVKVERYLTEMRRPKAIREPRLRKLFCCEQCDKSYEWPADLRKHFRVKHDEDPVKKERTPQKEDTTNGIGDRFRCKLCDKSYEWPSDLSRHCRRKHPEDPKGTRRMMLCNPRIRKGVKIYTLKNQKE